MTLKALVATGFLSVALVAAALSTPAHADEGMWTFDNFPSAAVKTKYGVTVDRAWLDHVQANAARLSTGCSSSIVSSNGLVLTNHHCVRDCGVAVSTAAITEALHKVYGDEALVQELTAE
jgi:imidazoleglycerol phosphate dehydratase HisB